MFLKDQMENETFRVVFADWWNEIHLMKRKLLRKVPKKRRKSVKAKRRLRGGQEAMRKLVKTILVDLLLKALKSCRNFFIINHLNCYTKCFQLPSKIPHHDELKSSTFSIASDAKSTADRTRTLLSRLKVGGGVDDDNKLECEWNELLHDANKIKNSEVSLKLWLPSNGIFYSSHYA